jgi:hypothetical protein
MLARQESFYLIKRPGIEGGLKGGYRPHRNTPARQCRRPAKKGYRLMQRPNLRLSFARSFALHSRLRPPSDRLRGLQEGLQAPTARPLQPRPADRGAAPQLHSAALTRRYHCADWERRKVTGIKNAGHGAPRVQALAFYRKPLSTKKLRDAWRMSRRGNVAATIFLLHLGTSCRCARYNRARAPLPCERDSDHVD